jgi:hypothetical protein
LQIAINIDADDLFCKMVERSELMLVDYEKNTLAFKHRTFTEFFYAKAALRDNDMPVDQRAFTFYWMNTFFFYLGLLKDAPEVLREIINLEPTSEGEKWMKVFNLGNFLLAAYTTPYEVISEGVSRAMLESAQLYRGIITLGSESPFAKMPRMHFLWLFQAILKYSYSYEFFIRALEETALVIDDTNLEELEKAYALFFTNVTYLETGAGKTFDFLLKEHSDSLPLDLALAYKHESEDIKKRTALMKKMDKRVKRLLKRESNLANTVKELYENPIGSFKKLSKRLSM